MWFYIVPIATAFAVNLAVRLRYVRKVETIPALEALVFAVVVYWATSWAEFFILMAVLCVSQLVFSPLSFGISKNKKDIPSLFFAVIAIAGMTGVFSLIFGGLTFGIQTLFF